MVVQKTRGGSNRGQGRHKKYNEQTKTISFRVPESKIEHVKSIVKQLLDGWVV